MSSNIAKRKREDEEPQVHCEDDWDEELYSNFSNYVVWNKYGNGEVASYSLLPNSKVLHGQSTVSNIGDITKVEESCLANISRSAETLKIEGELKVSTNSVEYSGNSEIEGEDSKKHIAILSEPANILAIKYASSEVF